MNQDPSKNPPRPTPPIPLEDPPETPGPTDPIEDPARPSVENPNGPEVPPRGQPNNPGGMSLLAWQLDPSRTVGSYDPKHLDEFLPAD